MCLQLEWDRRWLLVVISATITVALLTSLAVASAQEAANPDRARVVVLVATNIRATPAMNSSIVAKAQEGDEFVVVATSQDCSWLQIAELDDPALNSIGWITGNGAYTALSIACEDIAREQGAPTALFPSPTATVSAATLTASVRMAGTPIRSGPGSTYDMVRLATAGELLLAIGQSQNCRWLHVLDGDGQPGWVSGNPVYTQLEGDCTSLASLDPPTPTPVPVPRVTVLIDSVNVRSSASVRSSVLGGAQLGERYEVLGQLDECAWLKIRVDGQQLGWISGNKAYTSIDQPCSTLVEIEPTPAATPTATPRPVASGCATVNNELGFAVEIDIRGTGGLQERFSLGQNETRNYCLPVGIYTVVLSAQTRTDKFTIPLFVQGGENYMIPLRLP